MRSIDGTACRLLNGAEIKLAVLCSEPGIFP